MKALKLSTLIPPSASVGVGGSTTSNIASSRSRTTGAGQYLRHHRRASHLKIVTFSPARTWPSRYAGEARLGADAVTLHSLRHLGAELYYAARGDVRDTQRFLDHKRLDTTSIYLDQLTAQQHKHWHAMASKLGV